MKLILGGRAAGKREYVLSLGYKPQELSPELGKPVLYKLNNWLQNRLPEAGGDLVALQKALWAELAKNPQVVIVCDEVGSGIVPMDKQEREYRELVGRLTIALAKEAEAVVRVYCGIPTMLKETSYENF